MSKADIDTAKAQRYHPLGLMTEVSEEERRNIQTARAEARAIAIMRNSAKTGMLLAFLDLTVEGAFEIDQP